MSSSNRWSCGSRWRRDDRGVVGSCPENRTRCAPRGVLPGVGSQRILAVQVVEPGSQPPGVAPATSRRRGQDGAGQKLQNRWSELRWVSAVKRFLADPETIFETHKIWMLSSDPRQPSK